ncbi:MAG: hypothetical protein PUB49_05690 [Selenomonadaceae bacterium]|nr:hypothetical protein [Selenomonadaceae bacterium]
MEFVRKKWGIPIKDVWFNESGNSAGFSLIKIAYNLYTPMSAPKGLILKQWKSQTLISDISVSPEEIQAKFKSKVRNEIRRAVKEGVTTQIYSSSKLLENNIIDSFDKAYIAMYRDKGQKAKSIATRLLGIAAAGNLNISVASLPDGTIASWHSYVVGDGVARLLHSVSVFREEPEKRKMIDWANRLLHFEDMCTFGRDGLGVYDWGGISRQEKMRNITRFKEEFGGIEKVVYYCALL